MEQQKKKPIQKERLIVAVVVMLISLVMAVYGWVTLPAEVATQFEGVMNTGAPDVAKPIAVLVPFVMNAIFAWRSLSEPKSIFMCLFGYAVNVLFWMSN